jgi:hypothetical protein
VYAVGIQLRGQQRVVVDDKGHIVFSAQLAKGAPQSEEILPRLVFFPHLQDIDAPGDSLLGDGHHGPSGAVFFTENKIKAALPDCFFIVRPHFIPQTKSPHAEFSMHKGFIFLLHSLRRHYTGSGCEGLPLTFAELSGRNHDLPLCANVAGIKSYSFFPVKTLLEQVQAFRDFSIGHLFVALWNLGVKNLRTCNPQRNTMMISWCY